MLLTNPTEDNDTVINVKPGVILAYLNGLPSINASRLVKAKAEKNKKKQFYEKIMLNSDGILIQK